MGKATGSVMNIIYTGDGKSVDISSIQKSVRNTLVERFVECRKKKGWTQQELSKRSGVTRSNITRFESGRYNPSLEMLVRIASALEAELTIDVASAAKEQQTARG